MKLLSKLMCNKKKTGDVVGFLVFFSPWKVEW